MSILIPDIFQANNPNVPLFLINSAKGFQIVTDLTGRDTIHPFKRDLSYVCIVTGGTGTGIYSYIGGTVTDADWEDSDNWELVVLSSGEGSAGGFTSIITTDADVNPALPYTYYRIDASGAPRTVYLPDPVDGCDSEYSIELHKDTHKVTITTVSGVAGAVEGFESITIPTIGTALKFRCSGLNGYTIINDTRNLWTESILSADRDFTGDGFENNVLYKIAPATPGETVNILLPPPSGLNDNKIIRATFILTGEGTAVFSRSDGGDIGTQSTQIISKLDKGFTLAENETEYSIIQDSRSTSANLLGLNFYRLTEDSAVSGYRKLVTTKQDDDYSPTTVSEQTADITSDSFSSFIKYIASPEDTPNAIESSNMQFNVTTRKTIDTAADVIAFYRIFKLGADQVTETDIVSSSQFQITSHVDSQYTINVDFPDTTFEDGESLGLDVQLRRTGTVGADPSLTTKFEGTEPAYFNLAVGVSAVVHSALGGRTAANSHPFAALNTGETFTTTVNWGNIPAGTEINENDNLLSIFKNAYAPYQQPSLFGLSIIGNLAGIMEVGQTLTVSSATYNSALDSEGNPASDITLTGVGFNPATLRPSSPISADLAPYTVQKLTATSESWTLSGEDANTDPINTTAYRYWRWASKFGGSATVVSDAATAASVFAELNQKELNTGRVDTFTCDGNNSDVSKYTYYMYPASYGNLTSAIQDGAAPVLSAFEEVGDFTIDNDQGVSLSIKVYKSLATGAFASGSTVAFS